MSSPVLLEKLKSRMLTKLIAFIIYLSPAFSQSEWINLWSQNEPLTTKSKIPESHQNGKFSDVSHAQYMLYPAPAEHANGYAVAIFPGGGYGGLAAEHEGKEYAQWLNERGFTAMVVKYRVSTKDEMGYQYPVPYLDARRAIRTLRAKAKELGIEKVGVMGSSAGGHLASLCATHFSDTFAEETKDEIDAASCRPDFAILIYPVISMSAPLAHSGSAARLIGKNADASLQKTVSTELAVTAQTPPVFLLSTSDDRVDCRNSLLFAAACKENNVPVSLHIFEQGGHGYGLRVGDKGDLAAWPSLLDTWLKRISKK